MILNGVESQQAFKALKGTISQLPILAVPDFSKPFIIEIDTSSTTSLLEPGLIGYGPKQVSL